MTSAPELLCTTLLGRGPRAGQRCLTPIRADEASCHRCRVARRDRETVLSRPDTDRDRRAKACLEKMRAEIAARGAIGMEEADATAE